MLVISIDVVPVTEISDSPSSGTRRRAGRTLRRVVRTKSPLQDIPDIDPFKLAVAQGRLPDCPIVEGNGGFGKYATSHKKDGD